MRREQEEKGGTGSCMGKAGEKPKRLGKMNKNMTIESLEAVHTHTHTQMFLEEI